MANLMTALTGWELLFREDASSVVVKGRERFSLNRIIRGALVTVWKRENESGRDIQLLVRASDGKESESTTWLSTSREWYPRSDFQQSFPLRISPPAYVVRF